MAENEMTLEQATAKIQELEKANSELKSKNSDLVDKYNRQLMRVERLEGEREGWGDAFEKLADKLMDKIETK